MIEISIVIQPAHAADTAGWKLHTLAHFCRGRLRDFADGCNTSPVGFVEGWYVDDDVRRQGIGTRLVAAAEAWAVARSCCEMASDGELENITSQAAHRRLGYAEVGRVVRFRKALQAAAAVESAR